MAKPNNSMKTIQTPDGTDHEIVPEKMASGSYYADLDTLSADGKILSVTPITASSFTIQGQSVGLYRTTQTTTLYGKNSSDFLISHVYTNSIIKISRIESGTTYWTLYGDDYVTALVEGTTTSSTSTMFTTSADTQAIKNAYLKNATVSGSTLTITKQDNTTVTFTGGGGGGGSVDIDNTSITENSSNQIQTVGVIDQKTGNANKQWTGTLQEYNLLGTHDANTFYNITDDNASTGNLIFSGAVDSASSTYTITKTLTDGIYDIIAMGATNTGLDLYLLPNNSTRTCYGSMFKSYNNTNPVTDSGNTSGFHIGVAGTTYSIMKITLTVIDGVIICESNDICNFSSTTYKRNIMYYGDGYGTINSLVFSTKGSGTMNTGFSFKVYRRDYD